MNVHGIYDASGAPCAPALLHQGQRQVTGHARPADLVATEQVEGAFTYGGMIAGHFGHMLLETFARLRVFDATDLPVVFSLVPQSNVDLFWTLARAMGLPLDRIVVTEAPCRIARLHISPPDFEIRRRIAPAFTQSYAARGAAMAARLGVTENETETPAYLSRSKIARTGRYFYGETLLEAILAANGVDIIHLQDLSFDDQVRVWLTRRTLGGFTGSAFHPLLLTNAPKKLTYLATHAVNRNFRMIETHKSNNSRFCTVKSNPLAAPTSDKGPYLLSRIGIAEACRAMGVSVTLDDVMMGAYRQCVADYTLATNGTR